jgi:phage gp29-like protein
LSKAGSVAGYRHTSEARAAIGKALTGRQRPPDVVERVRQSQIGISKTPEARENISQAMLRYIAEHGCNIGGAQPPEIRLKMSVAAKAYLASNPNNFLGKSHTSKTKELLRQATLAQLASSPHPMLGKVHSEQTRAKLRAAWVRRKQRATEGAKT